MKIPEHFISAAKQPPAVHTAHAAASKPANTAAFRSSSDVFRSLGLPAGRLSAAVVAAARFFSLPLEPGLLAKIRRQAAQPGQFPQPGQTAAAGQTAHGGAAAATPSPAARAGGQPLAGGGNETAGNREAPALAAAAVADKGVELTPAGLADYAAAIDPEGGGNTGEQGGQGGKKRDDNQKNTEKRGGEAAEDHFAHNGTIDPLYLKEKIIEFAEKSPLLGLMNRLPGNNGRRWMVFPFSFSENGAQYRLSLSIMLDDAALAGQMTLEIVKSGADGGKQPGGADQHWLFVLDSGRRPQDSRLTLRLQPPRPQRALQSLARRLSQALNMAPERIFVENSIELSFFSPKNRQEVLLSVNEQV